MTGKLRDVLYTSCPYAGLDISQYPDDLQGWGSDHPVLTAAIEKLPKTWHLFWRNVA